MTWVSTRVAYRCRPIARIGSCYSLDLVVSISDGTENEAARFIWTGIARMLRDPLQYCRSDKHKFRICHVKRTDGRLDSHLAGEVKRVYGIWS